MFCEGVFTPGRRAATPTPVESARTSNTKMRRLVNLASFSTAVVRPSYGKELVPARRELAGLVRSRRVEHEQLRDRHRTQTASVDRLQDRRHRGDRPRMDVMHEHDRART